MSTTTQNEWTKKARDYILSKSQSGAYDLAGDIEDEVSDLVILLADARKEVIEEVEKRLIDIRQRCSYLSINSTEIVDPYISNLNAGLDGLASDLATLRKQTVSDPSGFVTEIVVTIEKPKI